VRRRSCGRKGCIGSGGGKSPLDIASAPVTVSQPNIASAFDKVPAILKVSAFDIVSTPDIACGFDTVSVLDIVSTPDIVCAFETVSVRNIVNDIVSDPDILAAANNGLALSIFAVGAQALRSARPSPG
jgi:hypothetical protein